MKHTIAVIVENNAGVLTRITGLFARRGYNIESLAVGETDNPNISRITLVVDGDETIIEQVTKQLYKLVEVVKLIDLTKEKYVARELVLMKIKSTPETRADIFQIVDIFRSKVIDISRDSVIIEATGDVGKLEALKSMLDEFGIIELVRTGQIALSRGMGK